MKFASVRVVTDQFDFDALVDFYARLTGVRPTRLAPGFGEIRLEGCTLAISSREIIERVNGGAVVPNANRSLMLEFEVDNVDDLLERATSLAQVVQQPTTMPWGNRSMLLRDPDGAIVNIFSRPNS
ncbi:VOC family protein [Devosia sp. CN2-171]|uniref:VOC family protein n=1 Tax=Devosia sp. CN2-171 TaxID=3400909 RepID=UPI003BF8939F